MSDMWGIHAAFLETGILAQHKEEIKTGKIVSPSVGCASNGHIPGAVGRTTCSSRLCSVLLTIS